MPGPMGGKTPARTPQFSATPSETVMEQMSQAQGAQTLTNQKPTQTNTQGSSQTQDLQRMAAKQQAAQATQKQTRPIGSLGEELFKRPVKDIATGLKDAVKDTFDINKILGINSQTDTQEKQAKRKQIHQRWQKLDQEQQQYAKQRYQEMMQKKQQEDEEKEMKRRQEKQQKSASIAPPSGTKKGPVGPSGSKKQKANTQLQQSRTTIGKLQGAN
jgi:hypothetical protein